MFNSLFYFCLFVFIETINIFNVTENYEGELKNNLDDKTNKSAQKIFLINTEEKSHKLNINKSTKIFQEKTEKIKYRHLNDNSKFDKDDNMFKYI